MGRGGGGIKRKDRKSESRLQRDSLFLSFLKWPWGSRYALFLDPAPSTPYRFFIAPNASKYAKTAPAAISDIPTLIAICAAKMALSTEAHPLTDQA
jgi:hypothetical protein